MKKIYFLGSITLMAACSALASDQTWLVAGSSDNWNSTELNWDAGVAWTDGNNAIFGGTGETVTVTAPVSVGGMTFTGTGYNITGSTITYASGSTIDASALGTGGSATATISSVLAGTGPITINSCGNTSASGGGSPGLGVKLNNSTNTFTGDVTITSGLVSYAAEASFGDVANKIILNGGGLLNATNQNLARNIDVQAGGGLIRLYGSVSAIYSGSITGSGTLRHTDGGTLTLSGNLSGYTGTINNQAGTLVSTSTSTHSMGLTGSGTFTKNASTGTLTLTDSAGFSGQVNVYGGTASTLILANTTGPALTGNISIGLPNAGGSGGTVQLGADNQISSTSTVTFGHAFSSQRSYLKLNGFSTQVGGLTNGTDLGGTVINGATTDSTLTIAGAGTYTFGPISGFHGTIDNGSTGKLAIVKNGSGTQTFTGNNTYTGGTTVTAGTLNAANNTAGQRALGAGNITVNGGTLAINAATVGQVTLGTGATLAMTSGALAIDITGASTFDKIVGDATAHFTLTGGTLSLNGFAGFEGTGGVGNTYAGLISGFSTTGNSTSGLTISGYDTANWLATLDATTGTLSFTATAVPEPSTYGLMGAGALAAVACMRRRRKVD